VLKDARYLTPEACGGHNLKDVSADDPCRVRVAVANTAFDAHHSDLRDNFAWNPALGGQRAIPKYGLDLVNSKVTSFGSTAGYDDVDPTTPSGQTDVKHGTHIAGIIAARDNGQGTTGVAPYATLVPIRILDDKGIGVRSAWHDLRWAVKHAYDSGAFVINNRWGPKFQADILEIQVEGQKRYFVRPRIAIEGRGYSTWPGVDSAFQSGVVDAMTAAN
jgi:subtilisin family serine protease